MFHPSVSFSHFPSSYLSSIERRVENVEQTLQGLQQHISTLSNQGQGKITDTPSLGQSSITGTGQLEVQEVAETNDSVDAMGALVFANEEESGFFGGRPANLHDTSINAALVADVNRSFFQYRISTPRFKRCNAFCGY